MATPTRTTVQLPARQVSAGVERTVLGSHGGQRESRDLSSVGAAILGLVSIVTWHLKQVDGEECPDDRVQGGFGTVADFYSPGTLLLAIGALLCAGALCLAPSFAPTGSQPVPSVGATLGLVACVLASLSAGSHLASWWVALEVLDPGRTSRLAGGIGHASVVLVRFYLAALVLGFATLVVAASAMLLGRFVARRSRGRLFARLAVCALLVFSAGVAVYDYAVQRQSAILGQSPSWSR